MFRITTNSILTINNSQINETYSYSKGGVVYADFQYVKFYAINTSFYSNYGVYGSIFFSQQYGYMSFTNCSFMHNFAI